MIAIRLKYKFLLALAFYFLTNNILAQSVSPSVTNAIAYKFANSGFYVDMSIGEVAIKTIKSSNLILTQGYLQPISIAQPCSSPGLIYYPNPVINSITLAASNCDLSLSYVEVNDLFGKKVLTVDASNNLIDLTPIGVGIYILRVYNIEGELIASLKIVKITV